MNSSSDGNVAISRLRCVSRASLPRNADVANLQRLLVSDSCKW
jgi:hypothetical protein